MAYIPAPETLEAFPKAERVKPKGNRRRWSDDEAIYEWDYQHGRVEKYSKSGHHVGEYDAASGEKISDAVRGRRIEV